MSTIFHPILFVWTISVNKQLFQCLIIYEVCIKTKNRNLLSILDQSYQLQTQ